jgi:rare lipoprotein A
MRTSYYDAEAPHIAAHRTLPIGTWLVITNPRNGRSACVMIGTRGPYTRRLDLDISEQFARILGFHERGIQALEARVVEAGSEEQSRCAAGVKG